MRKELYNMLRERLKEVDGGAIRHIDLWNHNVEFIEQEDGWERPAVFVEFCPIRWHAIVSGVEYRAEPVLKLNVVKDWSGSASDARPFRKEATQEIDLLTNFHEAITCMVG